VSALDAVNISQLKDLPREQIRELLDLMHSTYASRHGSRVTDFGNVLVSCMILCEELHRQAIERDEILKRTSWLTGGAWLRADLAYRAIMSLTEKLAEKNGLDFSGLWGSLIEAHPAGSLDNDAKASAGAGDMKRTLDLLERAVALAEAEAESADERGE
jgi:hypothetical protein